MQYFDNTDNRLLSTAQDTGDEMGGWNTVGPTRRQFLEVFLVKNERGTSYPQ
jgi:hypothetical protein